MRSRYKILNNDGIHFVTSTVIDWIEVFTNDNYFKILIDCISYSISGKNLKVYAFVLMKNHFHLICSNPNLSNIIRSIKSYSAKKIIDKLIIDNPELLKKFQIEDNKSNFQIWQEGFHPKEIISESEFKQKIEYIHNNPVKAGYVCNAEEWKYSSIGYYIGKNSLISIERIV